MIKSVYNVCCLVACLGLAYMSFEYNSVWAGIGSALALLSLQSKDVD